MQCAANPIKIGCEIRKFQFATLIFPTLSICTDSLPSYSFTPARISNITIYVPRKKRLYKNEPGIYHNCTFLAK